MSQQHSLEHYVTQRYLRDLSESGYQATCQNNSDMLEDALSMMAALNQASQFIQQAVSNKRATA